MPPKQIVQRFILHWQLEGTVAEVRAHWGVETRQQWSDKAIVCTTPALSGLLSLVALLARQRAQRGELPVRRAAWYTKSTPTFSDALAVVRQILCQHLLFSMCEYTPNVQKISQYQIKRLTSVLSYLHG